MLAGHAWACQGGGPVDGFLFLNCQPHLHLHRHAAVLIHLEGLLNIVVAGQHVVLPFSFIAICLCYRLQDAIWLQLNRVCGVAAYITGTLCDGVVDLMNDVPLRWRGKIPWLLFTFSRSQAKKKRVEISKDWRREDTREAWREKGKSKRKIRKMIWVLLIKQTSQPTQWLCM